MKFLNKRTHLTNLKITTITNNADKHSSLEVSRFDISIDRQSA